MISSDRMTMYEACLYHARADRALRIGVGKCIERYNVTMMEWLLLGVVGAGPSKGLNMSAIAGQLEVTMPQVTALTTQLIKHKLVKQKAAAYDRRNRFVIITVKGVNMLEDIEVDIEAYMRRWLHTIPDDALRNYLDTLKLISQLEELSLDSM
ncbi:MAG: hypothetical protein NVS1B7_4180 [Candidatus Saccharimonadales bacterium]